MTATNNSIAKSCWRLQCLVLVLVLDVAANGVLVEALRTVLDPNGLPLLQPARTSSGGLLDHDGSCKDTTTIRGWGGLRRVDLIYLGTFAVQHSSTAIRRQPSLAPRSTADLHLPEELAEAFLDMPGGKSDGGKAAPLLLLGEHVCALSLEKKEKQLESGGKFTLREPYSWESDLDVAGFALPRWMWDAVGGETGGGALLINPNVSSPQEQGGSAREAKGPSRAHAVTLFEPFVQVALWGDGRYHPLLKVSSTGISLEGGPGGVESGGSNRKAISTEGDLEISPAAGLHLLSGTEQGGDVQIAARGKRGGVYLNSDVLHWTSSSSFANSSGTFAADENSTTGVGLDVPAQNRWAGGGEVGEEARQGTPREHEASFRIDEDVLEARGMAAVKLGAVRSFDLAVVGWPEGVADGPSGGTVRGDLESVNASARTVNVQASGRVIVSGANRARVTSATGDVCLDTNDGVSSLRLSGTDIHGSAPTITFSAGNAPEMAPRAAGRTMDTTTRFSGAEDHALGVVEDAGGYLNLTEKSAVIGGPGDASVEAGYEVRLRASRSILRVSTATVAIQSPTILLQSPLHREPTPTIEGHPPLGPNPSSSSTSHEVGALMSLTGGVLSMNASTSIEWETSGAFAHLIGRHDIRSHEDVLASGKVGVFVADADAVEMRARSPAGVTITADGAEEGGVTGDVETVGLNAKNATTGARLEVSAEGVFVEGISTSVAASRRLTLRVGGQEGSMGQKGSLWGLKGEKSQTGSTTQPEGRGLSTVELGDGGVKVVAPSPGSIALRGGSGIILETRQLAISHNLGGEALSEERPSNGKGGGGDGINSGSGGGWGGGSGGGLWSDGITLTGRAHRRVLLQAGLSKPRKPEGDETEASRSHIAIEENRIRVCVGGARELALASPSAEAAANATGSSASGADFPANGLSLDVVGVASLSSTEDLELRSQEVLVSSSNRTLVYSPGGLLLAGSPALSSGAADTSKLGAARVGLRKQEGQILLAPGAGAGVGIGPVFSSRDLLAPIGLVPSLLYVTNSTRPASQRLRPPPDAHVAVESSGNSAVAVLSPRGAESAVRFGCAGLPYSGGLAVRHHLDAHAGDTLLLELASSPGRIVGDASGRWGVGAVPESVLEATLHVFALPKVTEPSGANTMSVEVPKPATAFLIESTGAGVMQLVSGTASSPQTSIANAIVLSSRPGRTEPKSHSHWVMSQLGDKAAVSRPAWADASADRSSWARGMTLTHVSGGGSTGWRSALETSPPTGEVDSEQIGARPHLTLSSNGRSGFGTGPTGARITVGGALVAEQVLVFSDEGMVRDVDALDNQGREQAMEALRQVDVVSFGWAKEASASYGLRPDVRQVGVIAQQVEKKASPSLVWQDATTGRKAVSYSRLLVTLVAAFQHLDGSVHEERKTWDIRLEGLERDAASAAESVRSASDRLRVVEAAIEAGIESSNVHVRNLVALEGRLLEQGGQAQAVGTDLAALQRKMEEEKGDVQEWRIEGSRREQELEREVIGLKSRVAVLEERRRDSLEDQKIREKAQDEQIQALSLRIGASHASQSRCDSSLLAEVEALRTSQRELESRLAPLLLRQQALAHDEEAYFLEEVERLESRIVDAELQRENDRVSVETTAADDVGGNLDGATRTPLSPNGDRHGAGGAPLLTTEIRQTLEMHKDAIRAEAAASLLSRREHLNALRLMRL